MHSWLVLISMLLGFTAAQDVAYSSFGQCSYTGDPHLIPFPSSPGQISNMYWCQKTGWEILLQNQWIMIAVQVSSSPYVILDYVVFFYNADGSIACVLIGSSGYSTCPSTSGITSITDPGGASWNHVYPLAQYLDLQISSYLWGSITRYDIIVRETFDLIKQSTGVCVKYNCSLEEILPPPPPIIIQICDIYIASAQKLVIGRVNEITVRFITIACQNDLTLTFNLKFAQTAIVNLIHSSLAQVTGKNYQTAVIKAEANIKQATLAAQRSAAALIGPGGSCLQQQRCLKNDDD